MRMLRALWRFISVPSGAALGTLVAIGGIGGILFWGGFNWALELTNNEQFCIGCHEMESTVYQELKRSDHYNTASGVRASCPDCHVPKDWVHKVAAKIRATFRDVPAHFTGYIGTKAKFEAHRLEMAKAVWARMEANDSRACRNCHSFKAMDLEKQAPRARGEHEDAMKTGQTCIECHKGIAHKDISKEIQKPAEGGSQGFILQ